MNKIIIFGAGENGRELLKKIDKGLVIFFSDNDCKKVGTYIENILVISFEHMLSLYKCGEFDIILSTDLQEMREQLRENQMCYWNNTYFENNYFSRPDIMAAIDCRLLEKYLYDKELKRAAAICECTNWYREEFCSDENKNLVSLMKENNLNNLNTYLKELYSGEDFFYDEYYENRPGMRLINNILINEYPSPETVQICELACGHGELLSRLSEEGFLVYGVDQNSERVQYVCKKGIKCMLSSVESVPCNDTVFDIVICQECLEHVFDPGIVVKEMKRILKSENGIAFCTVPFGKYCDDPSHVRQFYLDKFYSLFKKNGFEIINIIKVPYLNHSIEDNLFLAAKSISAVTA
jgi:ubiquinone/menaquinone biosynthesis C-methylase UbiE